MGGEAGEGPDGLAAGALVMGVGLAGLSCTRAVVDCRRRAFVRGGGRTFACDLVQQSLPGQTPQSDPCLPTHARARVS